MLAQGRVEEKRNIAIERWREREWRGRMAQGKSRREKENMNIAIERWREWRGRMAQGKIVREKRKKGI